MTHPLSPDERTALAEAIDRLMTVDATGRGFVAKAYAAARELAARPLVQHAGDLLLAQFRDQPHQSVLITTGATSQRAGLPIHIGEMDGPPGAIAMARFFGLAFNALPILVTDPNQGAMLSQACAAVGLYTVGIEDLAAQSAAKNHVSCVAIVELPETDAEAAKAAQALVQRCAPAALISTEKCGRNEHGVTHNSFRFPNGPGKAVLEPLFDACDAANIPTVAIGDGGNELGMGNIKQALHAAFPAFAACNCPCGGSIVAEQKASSLIVATVSNWGAYGLVTYMAAANGTPYAGHSPARERALLKGCAAAGYMAPSGYCEPVVDSLPEDVHAAFVTMLSCMVHWPAVTYGRAGILGDMLAR